MTKAHAVTVRPCTTHADFENCVGLQRAVWGFADLEIVAADLLVVAAKTGGQIFGAFSGERMIGFSLAVPALRGRMAYLHSHMVAVLPDYQNHGVGRLLKLAQREEAIAREIQLIEWTFDPLEIKNAYFNIARLGVIVRRYEPNLYGITTSPLHRGLPTDRLVAEWWLDSERVKGILSGKETLSPAGRHSIRFARPARETALDIQKQLRRQFQQAFDKNLVVTGFEKTEDAGIYWLQDSSAAEAQIRQTPPRRRRDAED